jgi:hypothetical protein
VDQNVIGGAMRGERGKAARWRGERKEIPSLGLCSRGLSQSWNGGGEEARGASGGMLFQVCVAEWAGEDVGG